MERTVTSIPLTLWVLTLWVTDFVSRPQFTLQIRAGRFNHLTGRPTEARWTPAAAGIIWHTGATVVTHAVFFCDTLTVRSSKTRLTVALWATFHHTLSTILTAQTGTGEHLIIATVEASVTLKEPHRGHQMSKINQITALLYN